MSNSTLIALADGQLMGEVYYRNDRLGFRYEEAWQSDTLAFPLSLSMPLVRRDHEHRVVEAFLWGLLPDNESVLQQWGKRFQVSSRNPFRLLENVGEDCAGAVQFVRPERLEHLLSKENEPSVHWLTEDEFSRRIATVVEDASVTRLGGDGGQFSLAGAQPKLALYREASTNQWGIPEGRTPTTHILKPANREFDGQTENEHFCLGLAKALGFPTADSWVINCGEIPVIVVERYDRILKEGKVRRIHQEDLCQANGIRPQSKYQSDGGPSPKQVGEILSTFSSSPIEDMERFAGALIFNWLMNGTDAHAKNYSMLLSSGSQARLAPLYDLASTLPYPHQIPPRKARVAMKIGLHYHIKDINKKDWETLARQLNLAPKEVLDQINRMATILPGVAETIASSMEKKCLQHTVIHQTIEKLPLHINECLKALS
ncbi:MAG: type II toxin-antitoxin system HipA family toxin [bacterium]